MDNESQSLAVELLNSCQGIFTVFAPSTSVTAGVRNERRSQLKAQGFNVAPENLIVTNGRVRAGYKIGEQLFGADSQEMKTVIHVIGERPGTKHDNYSVYTASGPSDVWNHPGKMDHDQVQVVAGISDTALSPRLAARQVVDAILESKRQNNELLKISCVKEELAKSEHS